ncbi:unnamed protein product [Hydatigera taeniaeformis]|uniref:Secreted protein n=1 Tax=Hydatigena taeniaeformis TaxID=6205 RepID=A0A0R3WMS0_HYDTA|nr:unnamed protein product [Hydatigera taeniaeformis]
MRSVTGTTFLLLVSSLLPPLIGSTTVRELEADHSPTALDEGSINVPHISASEEVMQDYEPVEDDSFLLQARYTQPRRRRRVWWLPRRRRIIPGLPNFSNLFS